MELIDIVEKLHLFPWAYVDIGYRQGREAVLEQFRNQFDQDDQYNVDRSATVDDFLSTMQNGIAELSKRAEPYALPEDYIIFLEHYGGLAIEGANYSFAIYGIGPMVETWYGYVNSGDHVLLDSGRLGWQSLGCLVFGNDHKYNYQRIQFSLDLAGAVQKHSVIGIGPWDGVTPREVDILSGVHMYPHLWKKLANSFTEFLEQAAETRGAFIYT